MTPVGINGDGLIPFKKAGSDTVQLIHAKPAVESHKRGHGRQHLAAVTHMPPPTPPTKMPLSLLPMCTTVACTAAVSTSQPSCVQLPPSTPCRLATSPFRTRKKFLHAYTTQYRASQCQASRPQEFVRIGPSVYGLWLSCLLPFRRPGGSTPTA